MHKNAQIMNVICAFSIFTGGDSSVNLDEKGNY
jgi:hypothetical protein